MMVNEVNCRRACQENQCGSGQLPSNPVAKNAWNHLPHRGSRPPAALWRWWGSARSVHFFGSIEELSVEAEDFVVGLMLHMDSIDPVGTKWGAAVLGHLDGAVNVYEGPAARERLGVFLHKGKVSD